MAEVMGSLSKCKRELAAFWEPRWRRNLLIGCTALALGGYGTYRLCTSSYVSQKRSQIQSLLNTLSNVSEAAEKGSSCTKLVCADLHRFLVSDGDEVPQSMRQLLKLGRSEDVKTTLMTLTAAISQGILKAGMSSGKFMNGVTKATTGSQAADDDEIFRLYVGGVGDTVSRLGRIKDMDVVETSKPSSSQWSSLFCNKSKQIDAAECEHMNGVDLFREFSSESEWMDGTWGSSHHKNAKDVGVNLDDRLPERMLGKLFSPAGTGFASAVVGSATRNFIMCVIECYKGTSTGSKRYGARVVTSCKYDASPDSASDVSDGELDNSWAPVVESILDFACSTKGRPLISECIETFVSTAVTAYLEKTKDVNVYEELVAGMTKPRHREPVKEILTSVCSNAVQTLVRTSHEVLSIGSSGPEESDQSLDSDREMLDENFLLDNSSMNSNLGRDEARFVEDVSNGRTPEILDGSRSRTGFKSNGKRELGERSTSQQHGGSESGSRSQRHTRGWVDGLSRTLAIPSNRKLVVEVARTVSAEAVKSFCEAAIATWFSAFNSSRRGQSSTGFNVSGQRIFSLVSGNLVQLEKQVGRVAKIAAARALVVMTICLALCLNLLLLSSAEPSSQAV